ncbi:MAG TPA: trans-aconitate 2-methyltransferase [Amaricoccus sp.]|nr:trans-aconitate 2-methyltransferase [Amaricoccus sp.]
MDWSAADYRRFEEERTRPARDLLAQVAGGVTGGVARVVDLGCGPGNSTELVGARFPEARVLGIDSSPDMIAAARRRLPGVDFALADVATWQAKAPVDLVFANAVLQWLPDHAALLPRLLGQLGPGGTLAVQVPDNLDEPLHMAMRATAAAGPWAGKLAGAAAAREARHDALWYWRLLRGEGARVEVWRTVYHHPLPGARGIVDWVRATGLRPFLAPLDAGERSAFLARYEAALAAAYPAEGDGTVLLPFPRLFLVAVRGGLSG